MPMRTYREPIQVRHDPLQVWRVRAATGSGAEGVYELDHACGSGHWRLRAVVG